VRRSLLVVVATLAVAALAPAVAAPGDEPPTVLVSRQLAATAALEPGQVVRLARDAEGTDARPFRIAGIYEPVPDPARLGAMRLEVRLHLPDLLALVREPGTPAGAESVDTVNIALIDPADAQGFASEINPRVPGAYAYPTRGASGTTGPFIVLERFHRAIAIVTILAATVFLLALTIMLVDERRETVGVLRLIGLPVRRILVQVLLEGVLIAAIGAAFGLLLAVASESLINVFFQWRYDTALVFVRVTPGVAALCLAIAVPLGAVATVLASWALLRREALRLARR
jgi:putative ABC transport system permease protein